MTTDFLMDSLDLALARWSSSAVLRRLAARDRESGVTPRLPLDDFGSEAPEELQAALAHAIRCAWTLVECSLADRPRRSQLCTLAARVAPEFIDRQVEAFLQQLRQAGLDANEADLLQELYAEVRRARQAGLFNAELPSLEVLAEGPPASQVRDEFGAARYARLAQLLALDQDSGEPLVAELVDYFFQRALAPIDEGAETHDSAASFPGFHDLVDLAMLVEERPAEVLEILDRAGAPDAEDTEAPPDLDDDQIAAIYQRGLTCHQNAEYERAIAHFTRALRYDSANALLYSQRGDAYRLLCDYERAIADFNAALRLSPNNAAVLVSRATCRRCRGEFAEAIADCTAALQLQTSPHEALMARGEAYSDAADYGHAIEDFSALLQRQPDDIWALHGRGYALSRQGDADKALADFTRALALNPNHVLSLLHRGDVHRQRGNFRQAILDYTEVLRLHPRNALALSSRGLALELMGDVDRALADYSEALKLDVDNAKLYCSRGILYRRKGDLASAKADFDQAIARQPENWSALYHRGKVHQLRGEPAAALLDFNEALYLNRKLVAAHLSSALAHYLLQAWEAAIESSTQALRLDPNSAGAHLLRALVYLDAGQPQPAQADLHRAAELDPEFAFIFHERGLLATMLSRLGAAQADFDQVLALQPRNPEAYVARGVVHQMRGDPLAALADFSVALQLDPKALLASNSLRLADSRRVRVVALLSDYVEGVRPKADTRPAPAPLPLGRAEPEPIPISVPTPLPARVDAPRPGPAPKAPETPRPQAKARPPAPKKAPTTPTPRKANDAQPAPNGHAAARRIAPPTDVAIDLDEELAEPLPEPAANAPSTPSAPSAPSTPSPAKEPDSSGSDLSDPSLSIAALEEASAHELDAISFEDSDERPIVPEVPSWKSAPAAQAAKLAACPMCRELVSVTDPSAVRVQCNFCSAVFMPSANGSVPVPTSAKLPVSKAPKLSKKQIRDEEDDRSFLERYSKPIGVVAALVALYIMYLNFPSHWFRFSSGRAPIVAEGIKMTTIELCEAFIKDKEAPKKMPEGTPVTISGEIAGVVNETRRIIMVKRSDGGKGYAACQFHNKDEYEQITSSAGKSAVVTGMVQSGSGSGVVEIDYCRPLEIK